MYFFQKKHCISIIVFSVILVCTSFAGPQDRDIYGNLKKTIVIDPGHGGNDTGTKGPDGTSEKSITLILARIIESELKTKYITKLTRKDDYWLDIYSRASTANNASGDLFISIHTGGSFLHKDSGMTVYYYKNIKAPSQTPDPDDGKTFERRFIKPKEFTSYIKWGELSDVLLTSATF